MSRRRGESQRRRGLVFVSVLRRFERYYSEVMDRAVTNKKTAQVVSTCILMLTRFYLADTSLANKMCLTLKTCFYERLNIIDH